MSDTLPFTAQQVRKAKEGLESWAAFNADAYKPGCVVLDEIAMLEQFAQRLEQEEQQQTAFAATEGAAYAIVPHGAAEALREEGRLEILKDVAKLDPMEEDGDMWVCTFCYPGWTEGRENVQHKPDCLFLRAQQARQTPETP